MVLRLTPHLRTRGCLSKLAYRPNAFVNQRNSGLGSRNRLRKGKKIRDQKAIGCAAGCVDPGDFDNGVCP